VVHVMLRTFRFFGAIGRAEVAWPVITGE
jgi:hypothetical protein